jgi:hypothetical protein
LKQRERDFLKILKITDMQVNQTLSILFYRKRKKANKKTGLIPLYCRVTIDGIEDEISTRCWVQNDDWETENKTVLSTCANYKTINKKLRQMKTDLERHFDLVVGKNGLATPEQVFASYQTPLDGQKDNEEKKENAAFSLKLDELATEVVKHFRKQEAWENKGTLTESKVELLAEEKKLIVQQTEKLGERGRKIWENKSWTKTLLNAIDEYVFRFMEQVLTGSRARPTFSKIITTKSRVVVFINKHYKKSDLSLDKLQKSFLESYASHIILHYENSHNTVWKNVQIIKDMVDRAYSKGWMPINPLASFSWGYKEPKGKKWPDMDEMLDLISHKFKAHQQELSDIRWCFVFQAFSGLSYAELYKLAPEHLVKGIDGKVKMAISDSSENFINVRPLKEFPASGGNLYIATKSFLHHKFCLIDEQLLINGSYNWSYAARNNEENITVFIKENGVRADQLVFDGFLANPTTCATAVPFISPILPL